MKSDGSNMVQKVVDILSADEIRRTLNRLASEIVERTDDLSQLVLLGIRTRGVPLAHLLSEQIQRLENTDIPTGALDITFYRDDLDKIGVRMPGKTEIPVDLAGKTVDLAGKTIVLVDDVIYSGRTVRAALNAVHDYGRPASIRLAVLIDRGHRQVPIHPDFVGKQLPTSSDETVRVFVQAVDDRDGVELSHPV